MTILVVIDDWTPNLASARLPTASAGNFGSSEQSLTPSLRIIVKQVRDRLCIHSVAAEEDALG